MYFLNTLGGILSLPGVAPTLYLWIAEITSNGETPNSSTALGRRCILHDTSIVLWSFVSKGGISGKDTDERASAFSISMVTTLSLWQDPPPPMSLTP